MRNLCISVALLAAYAVARPMTSDDFDFMSFISKYGKSYATIEEFNLRLAVFAKTAEAIRQINDS